MHLSKCNAYLDPWVIASHSQWEPLHWSWQALDRCRQRKLDLSPERWASCTPPLLSRAKPMQSFSLGSCSTSSRKQISYVHPYIPMQSFPDSNALWTTFLCQNSGFLELWLWEFLQGKCFLPKNGIVSPDKCEFVWVCFFLLLLLLEVFSGRSTDLYRAPAIGKMITIMNVLKAASAPAWVF